MDINFVPYGRTTQVSIYYLVYDSDLPQNDPARMHELPFPIFSFMEKSNITANQLESFT